MRIIKGSTDFVGFEITWYNGERSLSMTFWKWYLIFYFGG
jgi:hypothetical protein